MKKRAMLFLGAIACFSVSAQQVSLKTPSKEVGEQTVVKSHSLDTRSGSEAVIWSENFANGIPSTWRNVVTTDAGVLLPNGSWEYRGTTTTPNNTVGSRGGYVGTRGPIQSPTAANGFVIFDSDYMDNNGVAGNFGNGPAPAVHIAKLTTDTINLTGVPFVELKLHSYARNFQGEFLVAVSNNGGTTYADTIPLITGLGVNNDSPVDEILTANISATAGNQANVVLQFIFSGEYYFWMIDDIEVRDLPRNAMRFTEAGGAPKHDIIYNAAVPGYPKLGHISLSQAVPISFDSNIRNYGSQTQTNVTLNVELYRNNTLVTTLISNPPVASLAPGDTGTFVDFVTAGWTPVDSGDYSIVYTYASDSISGMMAERDTFNLIVSAGDLINGNAKVDVNGLDNRVFSNSFGTNIADFGTDGGGIGVMIPLENGDANGNVSIEGIEMAFSTLTIDGGDIQVEIYDTAGFDFTAGFGGPALVSESFNLSTGTSGTTRRFRFTSGNASNGHVILPTGTYYFVVYFFSNGGTNTIRVANDQSFGQIPTASIMYFTAASRWYTGYSNSRTFNSPWIRALSENITVSADEKTAINNFDVFPNPTTGEVNITLAQGGAYTIELVDMTGRVVSSENVVVNGNERITRNYEELTKGIYLINVKGENFNKTTKLTIK